MAQNNIVTIKQLLESGIHFGHITRKWNPKMKKYIFTSRNGIHIIDLKKTLDKIEKAYQELKKISIDGGKILFLATKKQIKNIVKEEAQNAKQYYIIHRWLGGTFTNFKTLSKRIDLLHTLYKQEKDGIWKKLPKKEVAKLIQKKEKLEKFLGGIKDMKKLPKAIFIVDPQKEIIAVREAAKLGIKIFGIVDTNCDPDLVDYIIPANDDAIRGVKLITSIVAKAMKENINHKTEDKE